MAVAAGGAGRAYYSRAPGVTPGLVVGVHITIFLRDVLFPLYLVSVCYFHVFYFFCI